MSSTGVKGFEGTPALDLEGKLVARRQLIAGPTACKQQLPVIKKGVICTAGCNPALHGPQIDGWFCKSSGAKTFFPLL